MTVVRRRPRRSAVIPALPDTGPRMIDSLTGLRALAAAWVIIHHFEPALLALFPATVAVAPLIGHGWIAVEIFFTLSGFLIAHNHADKLAGLDRAKLRSYWWARVARIYPVHLVTVVVFLLLVLAAHRVGMALSTDDNYTVGNILANVFVIHALPGFRALNWPAWSVSCEAVAYAAFPLLAVGFARLSPRRALGWAAASLLTCIVGMQLVGLLAAPWEQLGYASMWLRISTEFTAGALLWVWWRARGRSGPWGDVVMVGCVAVCVPVFYVLGSESPASYLVLPLIVAFVVACACSTGPLGRLFASRPAVWGGRLSYSVYMVHFFVFLVAKKLFDWDALSGTPFVVRLGAALGTLLVIVGAGAATFYLVEEPGRRVVRALSDRLRRTRVTT